MNNRIPTFKYSFSWIIGVCVILSSCSILQPPSIRSYNFKDRGDVCIAATVGVNYELQAAFSLIKHVYLQSGFRHANTHNLGIYSDLHHYNSKQIGLGYYSTIKTHSYIQFGAEFFDGKGKIEELFGNVSPEYNSSSVYFSGFAIYGLYSYYSDLLNLGFMFGTRVGKIKNSLTLTESIYDSYKKKIGILEHRYNDYYENYCSIFHRFKNQSTISFNLDIGYHYLRRSVGSMRISVSYQIPFNLRKKHQIN